MIKNFLKQWDNERAFYISILVLIMSLMCMCAFNEFLVYKVSSERDTLQGEVAVLKEINANLEAENERLKAEIESLKEQQVVVPVSVKKVYTTTLPKVQTSEFTEEEIYMLAQCVEAEAGKDNHESQKYVTQVILNRLHSSSFPDTLKEVIYQKNGKVAQFSVAYNGAMNREVEEQTLENVKHVLKNGTDLPENVLFFYADYVTNNWVNTLNTYAVVEGTVFAYK